MISLPLPPKVIQKKKNQAIFEVEALYPGYGVTVGNALRRVLLASLQGAAVVEVKIKGAAHEFSTMDGVLEDTIMILLNIKNLRFKIFEGTEHKVTLKVKKEGEVFGSDFECPTQVKLANPELHIATITDKKTELEIELTIQKGIGYVPKDQMKTKKGEIGVMSVDAIYTPIKNVNFAVENMRVGDRTDFDKLSLSIETDGTITPEEAFFEACDILIKHFNIIFEGKAGETSSKTEAKEGASNEELAKVLVEDLKLTARTLNALTNNNIKTVGGILRKSEKALSELEGMGEKALTEIKKKLKIIKKSFKNSKKHHGKAHK
jgi:DNA-directed RNA polymerase subunit alpha